jgi:hypothetical protein
VPPYLTPQISIASITNVNPLTPTAYRYYHQSIFCITHKLLVRYHTCELVNTKLHPDHGQKYHTKLAKNSRQSRNKN